MKQPALSGSLRGVDITADHVRVALFSVIAFVVSVSVHEFGHAFVADRLGDRIPRLQGRLTLSPIAHVDVIGTLAVPLFGALSGYPLIAWGKPVQTNPANYTKRFSMTTGHMLVAAAGPFMNLLLAVLVSIVIVALGKAGWLSPDVQEWMIRYLLVLNIMLLFFNLIPLGPLDGAAVLEGVLPRSMHRIVELNRKYGMLVLLVLFFSPSLGLPGLSFILAPVYKLTGAWIGLLGRVVPA
jgi:Zn-dependent protease